ncbi:restriction endonuclease subunit S [Acinetobacter nematophilus]|uniref:restriction endonuclease subunit S n=1 Tax=Acinetobacter TaxID=469 RepID=UPI0012508A7A
MKQVSLSEVYWFQEGPGVRNWQFKDSGIKLLNVANITKQGKIDLNKTDRHLSKEEVDTKYTHFLIDEGDLVIASSGITNDDDNLLRTKIAFIEKHHLPLCLNTSTIRFKSKEGVSDLSFLKHWLNSLEFRQQITKEVTGIAQKNFGPSHLKKIKISLPPLEEQRRIASILDQADELRQKRQQAIEKLDQLLQATFIDMFGDPVSNPKGWKIDSLNNYGAYKNGLNFGKGESGNQVLYIGVGDFKQLSKIDDVSVLSTINLNDLPSSDYFIKNGDLLFVRSNGNKELVGRCIAVYPNEKLVTYSGFCIRYRIEQSELTSSYLVHLFRSKSFKQTIFDGGQGANIQNINQQLLSRLQIPIPPKDLQEKWSKIVLNIEDQKLKFDQHLKIQNQLFISLQNQAFSGTL